MQKQCFRYMHTCKSCSCGGLIYMESRSSHLHTYTPGSIVSFMCPSATTSKVKLERVWCHKKSTQRCYVQVPWRRGLRLKGGCCTSWQKGGRCCLRQTSIWLSSSLCLQAVHAQPHNRGSFFHQYVNPACLLRLVAASPAHHHKEQSAAWQSLTEHVDLCVA